MKTIIAGSRGITDYNELLRVIAESNIEITEVVSGTARGVDQLGERYAVDHEIPVERFPADWDRFGKSAGYRRNEQMAQYADALIALRLDNSRGTTHMIDIARRKGLTVYVEEFTSV